MTQKELANELSLWFQQHKRDERKNNNPVWMVMKDNLDWIGHWKNLPRGNPRKGYRKMALYVVDDED